MGMLKICMKAALAATVLCGTSPAAAEPASADPMFLVAASAPRPREVTSFDVAGVDFAVIATGRFAAADTARANDDLEESLEMAKVMPGYPQPAYVTFDLKLAF